MLVRLLEISSPLILIISSPVELISACSEKKDKKRISHRSFLHVHELKKIYCGLICLFICSFNDMIRTFILLV